MVGLALLGGAARLPSPHSSRAKHEDHSLFSRTPSFAPEAEQERPASLQRLHRAEHRPHRENPFGFPDRQRVLRPLRRPDGDRGGRGSTPLPFG